MRDRTMTIDYDALNLTELIKLKDEIERETRARYQKSVALVFTDVVGSTAYFERFGDSAGRALLQRHLDLLDQVMGLHQGRVVDTAGDGAFCTFERLLPAVLAMCELQSLIAADNGGRAADHRMGLRIGIHLGEVLTDGTIVTGDAVHLAARISSAACATQILMSQATAERLPPSFRVRCRPIPPGQFKGFSEPVPLSLMEWRDPRVFPSRIRMVETGAVLDLPPGEVIRFGRLAEHDGRVANEVVLHHRDPDVARRISRWHFELHRRPDGMYLQAVSRAHTVVDGQVVSMGQSVQVKPGAQLEVAYRLGLELLGDSAVGSDETLIG
jgi:class 3 adenylate cyclase